MELSLRQRLEIKLANLRNKRETWDTSLRGIFEHMRPYGAVWDASRRNLGFIEDSKILNSTPVEALETLSAGMMAGITSPARPWFKFAPSNSRLAKVKAVQVWLEACREEIATKLQTSGFYTTLGGSIYPDLGSAGQSAMFLEEGEAGQMIFTPIPHGEYFLDQDHNYKIDTCFRDLTLTVRQMVQKFGQDKLSAAVRNAYERGDHGSAVRVIHYVGPNGDYKNGRLGPEGMRFKSCWWEWGQREHDFLVEKGYYEFPVIAPRWSVRSGDVYGRGPGWKVRGDCRMLQHHERTLLKLLDKSAEPPMKGTNNVRSMSHLPGDMTRLGRDAAGAVYEAAYKIEPASIANLGDHIARVERRIERGMYSDLWRRLIDDERQQRATATEIQGMRQEVMLMLGPLLENMNDGLLEPALERAFFIQLRADQLPPPPEEMMGAPIKIEFVSVMHELQRQTSLPSVRTLMQESASVFAIYPEARDKIDADVLMDEIGRASGVRPDIMRSKEDVEQRRSVRAEAEAAQQQKEDALATTEGIRNVSGADPQQLSDLAGALSPIGAAQLGAGPSGIQ